MSRDLEQIRKTFKHHYAVISNSAKPFAERKQSAKTIKTLFKAEAAFLKRQGKSTNTLPNAFFDSLQKFFDWQWAERRRSFNELKRCLDELNKPINEGDSGDKTEFEEAADFDIITYYLLEIGDPRHQKTSDNPRQNPAISDFWWKLNLLSLRDNYKVLFLVGLLEDSNVIPEAQDLALKK